jgi:hypothetical protein
MAIDDIVFPADSQGFIDELPQTNFTGPLSDIVYDKDEIAELVILITGGEASWVF